MTGHLLLSTLPAVWNFYNLFVIKNLFSIVYKCVLCFSSGPVLLMIVLQAKYRIFNLGSDAQLAKSRSEWLGFGLVVKEFASRSLRARLQVYVQR